MIPKVTSLRSVFICSVISWFLELYIALLWLCCILSHHYVIFVLTLDSPTLLFLVGLNMSRSGLCYTYIATRTICCCNCKSLMVSSIFGSLGSSLQYLMLLFCSVVAFRNFYSYLSLLVAFARQGTEEGRGVGRGTSIYKFRN